MTDPIKVAVLGMAHDHLWGNLKELADQEGASLVGGADPNPVLQDRFRERAGCDQVYGEYEALLDEQTPDAAFVFSATAHHAPSSNYARPGAFTQWSKNPWPPRSNRPTAC